MAIISAKINVTKFDKTKFFKGEKGTYADIVLIETPNGKYGDFMVVQGVTKEERAAGKQGAILGNGKWVGAKPGAQPAARTARPKPPAEERPPADEDGPW